MLLIEREKPSKIVKLRTRALQYFRVIKVAVGD